MAQALPVAKKLGDRDTFKNVSVSVESDRARISAERYSVRKCTSDPNFYMTMGVDSQGKWHILEQFMETWTEAQCGVGEGKPLQQRLDEIVGQLGAALPFQADADTRVDALTHQNGELRYEYSLTSVKAAELDLNETTRALQQLVRKQSCKEMPALLAVLKDGGHITFAYVDSAGHPITRIAVGMSDCNNAL